MSTVAYGQDHLLRTLYKAAILEPDLTETPRQGNEVLISGDQALSLIDPGQAKRMVFECNGDLSTVKGEER
jgi:hypothetical protein